MRLFDKNLLYTPWNKLYLSSYILENKLYFPQTFWDDFPFNLSVVRDVEADFRFVGQVLSLYTQARRKRNREIPQ